MKEIVSLHKIFSVNPIFGVDFHEEEVRNCEERSDEMRMR